MKKRLFLTLTGALALTATLGTTAAIIASCSSTNENPTGGESKPQTNALSDQIIKLKNDFDTEYKKLTYPNEAEYFRIDDTNKQLLIDLTDKYIKSANQLKTDNQVELAKTDKANIDNAIWLDALIETLETRQQLLKSNISYLLVNQWFQLSFTNYSSDLASKINNAINNSQSRSFVIAKDDSGKIDVNASISKMNDFKGYIDSCLNNLTIGSGLGITPSKVFVKHSIGNLLQTTFRSVLDKIVKTKTGEVNVADFLSGKISGTSGTPEKDLLITGIKNALDSALGSDVDKFLNDNENFRTALTNLKDTLYNFVNYILGDYYKGINYGFATTGTGNSIKDSAYTLKVVSNKPSEEDNGYQYNKAAEGSPTPSYIYLQGLGFDKDDLNAKDIGIGFMKGKTQPAAGGTKAGEATFDKDPGVEIYNALLRLHSNTTQTAKKIFDLGNNEVVNIKENMKEVAKTVAEIYAGPNQQWAPTYYYDADGAGNEVGAEPVSGQEIVSSNGTVNLPNFFKWLNGEQWFNGRDMTAEQRPTIKGVPFKSANGITKDFSGTKNYEYKSEYIPKNTGKITQVNIADIMGNYENFGTPPTTGNEVFSGWKLPDGQTEAPGTKVWGDAGNLAYKYLVLGLSPSTIEESNSITNATQTNSISPEAAFVGTSHAFYQYLEYKDVISAKFNNIFKPTAYDYTLRSGVGGAAYASGGDGSWSYKAEGWGGFYLDSNPYFGLQKWSMSTLSNHEAIPGHVYQFNYAHDHPAREDAPVFDSTAFAEGWGLFAEWLGVQIGCYGTPVDVYDSSKKEPTNELGLPDFSKGSNNVNVTVYTEQYAYANGVYWIGDDKSTTEIIETEGNSQKLYNAVQYFGFLNERQLRAMRCAVDTGIHSGATINVGKDGTVTVDPATAGSFKPNSGWSLNESRAYLTANSGLGINDIQRETKRYLEYTGQATSYFNGTVEIQNMFMNAAKKWESLDPTKNILFIDSTDLAAANARTAPLFDLILRNGDIPVNVLSEHVNKLITDAKVN